MERSKRDDKKFVKLKSFQHWEAQKLANALLWPSSSLIWTQWIFKIAKNVCSLQNSKQSASILLKHGDFICLFAQL